MLKKPNNITVGIVLGAIYASIFVVLLTIVGELFKPLKTLLTEIHSHHWVGKGIWASILFFVVWIVSYFMHTQDTSDDKIASVLTWFSYTLIFVTFVLFAFFIYEYGIKD